MSPFDWFRYLPQLPEDDIWGISVRGAGRVRSQRGKPYPPRGHPADHNFSWATGRMLQGFQIVFISEGQGRFESRPTGIRRVEAGDAILVFPAVWHRYEPDPSIGWIERWVELDGSAVSRLLSAEFFEETQPIARPRDPSAFANHMERLLRLVRGIAPGARAEAGAIGHVLLTQLQTQYGTGKQPSPAASMVAAAERLLSSGIDDPLPMPEIARRLGLSYSYLRREFKRRTGLSPKKYLQRMRLERARRLLGATADPLDRIAERVGFCSAFHLSAAFKKEFHISPRQWREKHCTEGNI